MCAGYIVDNLGFPGIEEKSKKKKKFFFAPSSLYRGGRLTDKLIEKLGLLQLSRVTDGFDSPKSP